MVPQRSNEPQEYGVSSHNTYARGAFENILRSAFEPHMFYMRVATLLDHDPYFMRGYLELLWIAEKKGDRALHADIRERCLRFVMEMYTSGQLRKELSERWTADDREALKKVLMHIRKEIHGLSVIQRIALFIQYANAHNLIPIKTETSPREEKHLRLIQSFDVSELQKELRSIPAYWWGVYTERSEHISYHRHTHSIVLRERGHLNVAYEPFDGVHESVETPFVKLFPKTHETIKNLAHELKLGLGRVALVRLQPYSQVYRHYDNEDFLQHRERYHVALQCGDTNMLESGNNTFQVKEGQVWFLDNKVMHRAENGSDVPRIHIIFDGYPLT